MRFLSCIILFVILGCNSGYKPRITKLDLSNQHLVNIPDSVFKLTALTHLELGNHSFTLYPPLSALTHEQSSDSMNQIAYLPREIAKLKNLRYLGMCFNGLKALPRDLVQLKHLDSLDLSFNQQLNIKKEIKTLTLLSWLNYLNVVGTRVDQEDISALHKLLPKTRIIAKFEDLSADTPE